MFTLENNATLLTIGSGNKINTGTGNITLNGKLAFENLDQTNATVNFNTIGAITGFVAEIDIRNTVVDSQCYVLAKNTGTTNFSSLILPITIKYGGFSIENTRADKKIVTTNDADNTLVLLVDKLENTTVTWTGKADSTWNISNHNWNGKIEADDYTFGIYSRLKISEIAGIFANTFLAYGHQNYELHRNVANSNTRYNGNSMYASLELFKPIRLRNNFTVSPLAAVDFQKSASSADFSLGVLWRELLKTYFFTD
ncbi:MAG: autotransporter outer membrane beta-barrel domain-containing protein [Planctomycetaceae bacterium]|jgi:hypothetical protein|nr:autotransporter outer membrane beta-barrel domain-containing protein [Planctomycetaceae bacterium]